MPPAPAATCAATATPAPVNEHVAPAPAVLHAITALTIDYVTLAPADAFAAPAPVTEYVTPTPTDLYAAPARVIEHVAPAPVIEYIAPASPVTISSPSQQLPPAYHGHHRFGEPAMLYHSCGNSAPQVVGSISLVDDVHNQVHQLLLMTGRIEKLCEAAETASGSLPPLDENVLLAKRTIEQQGRFPCKRRRIPLPLIPEEGTDV